MGFLADELVPGVVVEVGVGAAYARFQVRGEPLEPAESGRLRPVAQVFEVAERFAAGAIDPAVEAFHEIVTIGAHTDIRIAGGADRTAPGRDPWNDVDGHLRNNV